MSVKAAKFHGLLMTLFLCGSILSLSAQTTQELYKPDFRLYACMDKTTINKLSEEKSDLILYYNYYLGNSYYTIPLKAEKAVTGTDIRTVASKVAGKYFTEKKYGKDTFNPLQYDFTRSLDGFTTYIWKDAGLAIVFYPQRHFQAQFREYLQSVK